MMELNMSMIIGWLCGQMKLAERDLGIYKEDGIAPAMKRLVRVSNMSLSSMQAEAHKVSSRFQAIPDQMERDIKRSRIVRVLARSVEAFSRLNAEQIATEIIKELEK